jgi:uncharacterized membrane protein
MKASSILYVASAISGFLGVMTPLLEMITRRPEVMPDTFIELIELNPYSQIGLIGIVLAIGFFLLGLMTDRRGG